MEKVDDVSYPYTYSSSDDVQHTFFECARRIAESILLEQEIGSITPENIVE